MALLSFESFLARVRTHREQMRIAVMDGQVAGLCICRAPEMYQLFVARAFYGKGVASALLTDAEARLSAAGTQVAWLACVPDNERAITFYRKAGWRSVGQIVEALETSEGVFELPVIRFEKQLLSA